MYALLIAVVLVASLIGGLIVVSKKLNGKSPISQVVSQVTTILKEDRGRQITQVVRRQLPAGQSQGTLSLRVLAKQLGYRPGGGKRNWLAVADELRQLGYRVKMITRKPHLKPCMARVALY